MLNLDEEQSVSALELIHTMFPNAQYKKIYLKNDPAAEKYGTSHKAPIDNKLYTYSEVKDWNKRIGWLVPKGVVVVDIDNIDLAKRVKKVLRAEGLDTIIFNTEHGAHFIFKSVPGVFQTQSNFCRLGIKIDTRSDESGYIIIPHNDEDREIYTTSPKIPILPQYLKPERSEFPDLSLVEEGERNGKLFDFMVKLKALKDISIEDVKQCVILANEYILKKPLSDKELAKTILSEKNLERGISAEKISPNLMAQDILQEIKVITTNAGMYMYNGKYYRPCTEYDISRYIHSKYQEIGKDKRKEVFEFIRLKTYHEQEELNRDYRKIVLRNGILNIESGELTDFDSNELITRYIDIEFIPHSRETTSGRIDSYFDGISGGREDVKQKLYEFIGYCLIPDNRFQKIFFLLGPAHTGKSTFLRLVEKLFSPENCASLSISDLEQTFLVAELQDKLVNLGDELSVSQQLDGTMIKVLCGELPITVQRKFERPFKLRNNTKFIFTCNKMPILKDKTDGMHRRLEIIEITNRISLDDRDTMFIDKFTHEDMQYLLYQAFLAINQALKVDHLTNAICCEEALEKFRTQQSTTLSFIKENPANFNKTVQQINKELKIDKIETINEKYVGRRVSACYEEYLEYCRLNGKRHSSYENFIAIITDETGLVVQKGIFEEP